jgi:pyruvate,water dikinase
VALLHEEPEAAMDSPADLGLVLALDSLGASLDRVGGKGASLARMAAAGLPVPPGFHLTTQCYRRFVDENHLAEPILAAAAQASADDPATFARASAQIQTMFAQGAIPGDLAAVIRAAYQDLAGGGAAVAVRSSATAEDLPGMSFAGQQETYLNVIGIENVLAAAKRCWASLWTARAIAYRARHGIPSHEVALAVVVQQLVPADAAGILFTANPLTGAREQVMINAAWGLGEAIVGGLVTPDSFVVNKQTGAVESQEIADKAVMTARSTDGTKEEPVQAGKRREATLEPAQAAELARLGVQIEQLYGQPMDIEWALDHGRYFILQARPITALPRPRAALDWSTPRPRGRYARSSAIELLPDPLTPLFASLCLPAWDKATRDLMDEIGIAPKFPGPLFVTINDYAYYDFSWIGGWQMLRAIPRMMPVAIGWMRQAQSRWADGARPPYVAAVAAWSTRDLTTIPAAQLLNSVREIAELSAYHYLRIQSGILPVAYMSETLFTFVYNKIIKRKDDPPALVFLLGFDSAPILAEKSLYDLASWARTRTELASYLAGTPATEIVAAYRSPASPMADPESWDAFRTRFTEHLREFGHAVYDLDFAKGLAADDPAPLLESFKYFLTGAARNPHERQAVAAAAREHATELLLARLKGFRLRWFKRLLRWAQRYAPLREDALADVGLGWPLVRQMLQELGRRLVAKGRLGQCDDVFWLTRNEGEAAACALDAGQPIVEHRSVIADRRALWERERAETPPVTLPIKGGSRFLGIDFSRWMPAQTNQPLGDTIRGIAASPGRVVGEARVLGGPSEFDQMHLGGILVAKITTPAWTPLFALASGIVTDVGGPLSHSSIVAREYQIPAVLGTGVATARIRSGQRISVDGDSGVVTIKGPSPSASP